MILKKKLRNLKYRNEFFLKLISGFQYISIGRTNHRHSKEIINCGAPRSGSTLLNMIINKILMCSLSKEHNYAETSREYLAKLSNSTAYNLIKVHHYFPLVYKRIKKGKAIGFFTHRDIRDIVVSFIQKGWISDFNEYIEQKILHRTVFTALAYAKCPNMQVISYYDLMHNKEDVIISVSKAFNVSLNQDEIQSIIEETSLESVNKDIKQMDTVNVGKTELNPGTGLHKDHIADGRIGKWNEFLSKEQIDVINSVAAEYNKYFNYQ